MPTQFTGNVEPPKNLQFGADSYVDSSNSLEGLEEGAKALQATTGQFVMKRLQNDILAEDATNQSRYEEIRRTKKALYDAADNRDEENVVKFGRQLEELTIAENQGAISGSNASIRKESLLRTYITRFPHREEEIRQMYSTTRRQLQEGRAAKVSDPIEEGINDVLEEAVKKGKSPISVLEDRQHNEYMDRAIKDMQYQVALGGQIAGPLEQAFDQNAMPIFFADATDYIHYAMQTAQAAGADVDAVTVKRNLEIMKQGARQKVSATINNLLAVSPEPGATLSPDFRNAQLKKVDDLYDGMIAYSENVDTLKAYARGLEFQKNKTVSELRKVDPMLRGLIDIGAVEYAGKYLAEDYPAVATVLFTQGRAGLEALLKNAQTPMERNRLKLQMHMLGDGYDPDQQAADLTGVVQSGTPPEPTGDSYVDAIRLSGITDSLIKSSNVPPEVKDNAGVAILEAEKSEGSYLGPGAHWYKNPTHLRQLSGSDSLKARMREEITGTSASVTRQLSRDPELAKSLMFAPNLEEDMKNHRYPWKAYTTGGPFGTGVISDREDKANLAALNDLDSLSQQDASAKGIVDTLNNAYWILRRIDGAPAAEDWASQILELRDEEQELIKKEKAAKEGDEEQSFDQQPVFDLTD